MIQVPGYNYGVTRFNDGTPRVVLTGESDWTADRDCATVYWCYDASRYADELFELACIRDHLDTLGVREVDLVMPYVPNARMDRQQGDDAFTLKTFAKMINSMNFDKVTVFDPHSDVAPALLDRCEVRTNGMFVDRMIDKLRNEGKMDYVIFPDAGAEHRYSGVPEIAFFLRGGYGVGIKKRDWKTQHITGYALVNGEGARGKDVVIVDDIVAHGYTLKFLVEEIQRYEPRSVTAVISHLEDSYYDGVLYKEHPEVRILTTDTILRPHVPVEGAENVEVFPMGVYL